MSEKFFCRASSVSQGNYSRHPPKQKGLVTPLIILYTTNPHISALQIKVHALISDYKHKSL